MFYNQTQEAQATIWVPGVGNVIAALLYIVISAVGTAGNFLVLLAVCMSRRVQTTTTAFVAALSVSDLITSITLPIQSAALLGATSEVFLKFCAFAGMSSYISIGSNVLLLAEIAFNRFICITKQTGTYNRQFTKQRVTILIALSYAIPFAATVLAHALKGAKSGLCPPWKVDVNFCTVTGHAFDMFAVTLIAVAVTTTLVFYILIIIHIRRHCQVAVEISCEKDGSTTNTSAVRGNETSPNSPSVSRPRSPARSQSSYAIRSLEGTNRLSKISPSHLHPSSAMEQRCSRPVPHASSHASGSAKNPDINVSQSQAPSPRSGHRMLDKAASEVSDMSESGLTGSDTIDECAFSNDSIRVSVLVHGNAVDKTSVEQTDSSCSPPSSNNNTPLRNNHESSLVRGNSTENNPQPRRPRLRTVSAAPVMNPPHKRYRFRFGRNNIESKVTKNMFLVVIAFLICLFPMIIFVAFVKSLTNYSLGCTLVDAYVLIILSMNCAINPILYGWRHPLFRKIFMCIFHRKFSEIELPSPWLRWLLRH